MPHIVGDQGLQRRVAILLESTLDGDDQQSAAAELARGLAAVEEPPHPCDRLLGLVGVAVVDAQCALGPVLAGLGGI